MVRVACNKKLKSFTLQEMVVVLLITTIVVGMAFSVLRLVQNQMGGISAIYTTKTKVNKLQQSLWIDFDKYETIYVDALNHKILFSNELEERWYRFIGGQFIRDSTLQVSYTSLQGYFENKKVAHGTIDALAITTGKDTGAQQIFVYKVNTPTVYLNKKHE